MTIGELREALDNYNPCAKIVVGVDVPDLFIATPANLSVVGNQMNPKVTMKPVILVECVPLVAMFVTIEAARICDLDSSSISKACLGKLKTCDGYT